MLEITLNLGSSWRKREQHSLQTVQSTILVRQRSWSWLQMTILREFRRLSNSERRLNLLTLMEEPHYTTWCLWRIVQMHSNSYFRKNTYKVRTTSMNLHEVGSHHSCLQSSWIRKILSSCCYSKGRTRSSKIVSDRKPQITSTAWLDQMYTHRELLYYFKKEKKIGQGQKM